MLNLTTAIALEADYHRATDRLVSPYSRLWYLTLGRAKSLLSRAGV